MKELSLNILDIAENSVKAGASLVTIRLLQESEQLTLTIADDGCGMSPEILSHVTDPFYTTRTTRKVGLGLPLLKMEAEQTGGSLTITSTTREQNGQEHGTTVQAIFYSGHLDFTPIGDVTSTLITLIQGHPGINFLFEHKISRNVTSDSESDNLHDSESCNLHHSESCNLHYSVHLDTREIREVLGDEVTLDQYDVIKWIESYLQEQYEDLHENTKDSF